MSKNKDKEKSNEKQIDNDWAERTPTNFPREIPDSSLFDTNPENSNSQLITISKALTTHSGKNHSPIPRNKNRKSHEGSPIIDKKRKVVKPFIYPNQKKKIRYDHFGTEINHKNRRKVKVTFIDKLDETKFFTDIVNIESWKEYNYVEMSSIDDFYIKPRSCCSCNIY